MRIEKFRYLAGVIAAHPDRRVVGRKRLQKTVRLLQRLGFPTDYGYTIHFYGPYSEGVQSDIGLLKHFKMLEEELHQGAGEPYYVMEVSDQAALPEVIPFQKSIDLMSKTDTSVLELAATYDAFRERGYDHEDAVERVRRKKGKKCDGGRLEKAFELLDALKLSHG